MNFNNVLEWLRKYDFTIQHSEHFHSKKLVFCKKEQINIVLKEYYNPSPDEIRSDSVDIRNILNNLNENVWNTYFLISSNNEEKLLSYSLEKDSIGVRKYVINTIDDIKRIPFLDKITASKGDSDKSAIKIYAEENPNINEILDYLISIDGFQRDLIENEVSEIVSKFIDVRMNENEN